MIASVFLFPPFCSFFLPPQSMVKKSTLSQDWAKETEGRIQRENRREGIRWAQVSNKKKEKKAWHGFLVQFCLSSCSSLPPFKALGVVFGALPFVHVKQWLFQDSLIRRLFLSLKAESIIQKKRTESGKRWVDTVSACIDELASC